MGMIEQSQMQGLQSNPTINGKTTLGTTPPPSLKGGDNSRSVAPQSHLSQSVFEPALNFHIERLTLHGFSALDRNRIGAAMEAELARLLAEGEVPPVLAQGGVINQLDGGAFEMASGIPPRVVGVRIAQAIYGELSDG